MVRPVLFLFFALVATAACTALEPPQSLHSMLRLAAQLEELADAPAQHRGAAAKAILPPAPAANHSLQLEESVPMKVPPLDSFWQAASPWLPLVITIVVICALYGVCYTYIMMLPQRPELPGSEPKQSECASGRELRPVPQEREGSLDRELVLELVLSQEGPNGRTQQQLLQRARQLSRSWRRRIPSLRQALAPAAAERAAAMRAPPRRPMVALPPSCPMHHGRTLVVELG